MATTRALGDPSSSVVIPPQPPPAQIAIPLPEPPPSAAPPIQPPATAAAIPAAPGDAQIDEEDRAAGATSTEQHVAVPHEAFRKIKNNARDKGRRDAEAALSKRAIALGFPTVEEMFATLEQESTPTMTTPNVPAITPAPAPAAAPAIIPAAPIAPAPAPAPAAAAPAIAAPPVPPEEPENDRRVPDNVRKKLRAAREDMRTKIAAADQQRTAAESQVETYRQQLAQFEAERSMREDLIRAGVKELDFTWLEMQKHLRALAADKTPEGEAKLKAFDLKVWADEQRKVRPFLFGEMPVPANTGVPTPPPGAPPGPAAVTSTVAGAGQVDARKLSPAEFKARMAQHGINTR